jgi:hypothetical protein
MQAAVLGRWQGTAELEGETVTFTLSLQQASATTSPQGAVPPPLEPQCGSRSFVTPAAACLSISTMALVGTLTSEHPKITGAVAGRALAYRNVNPTELELELEDGTTLEGMVDHQALAGGTIAGGDVSGRFDLARP